MVLENRSKTTQAQNAVAHGVKELLERIEDGAPVLVREPQTNVARPIEPGDIAVLCKTNDQCARIAET